jgi:C4-dicarboxylate transporter
VLWLLHTFSLPASPIPTTSVALIGSTGSAAAIGERIGPYAAMARSPRGRARCEPPAREKAASIPISYRLLFMFPAC